MKNEQVEMGSCAVCGCERELHGGLMPEHSFPLLFDKPTNRICTGSGLPPQDKKVSDPLTRNKVGLGKKQLR